MILNADTADDSPNAQSHVSALSAFGRAVGAFLPVGRDLRARRNMSEVV